MTQCANCMASQTRRSLLTTWTLSRITFFLILAAVSRLQSLLARHSSYGCPIEEQGRLWGVPAGQMTGFKHMFDCAKGNPSGDKPLGNPHNFSSNPGFMGTSTQSMLGASAPANGGTATIRTSGAPSSTARVVRRGGQTGGRRISAPGVVNNSNLPESEGSPMTFGGGGSWSQ